MLLYKFIFVSFSNVNIEISDLTGGSSVFFLCAYSYISDVSNEKNRTRRFAYLDGLFPLGFYTANALAGPIKQNLGLMYNFALGMLCSIVCFAYCLVFVKDSRKERDERIAKEREEMLGSKNEYIGKFQNIEFKQTYFVRSRQTRNQ